MHYLVGLSEIAVVVRHWFEIDLDDSSMEHGSRIEVRRLVAAPHRGSESAAQLITADQPIWRADLFDRLGDQPGTFGVAHFHPAFDGNEPCDRVFDARLTTSPWEWLHEQVSAGFPTLAGPGRGAVSSADQRDLAARADTVVLLAQQFAPDLCTSAGQCRELTGDVAEAVRMMIATTARPDLLDRDRVALWA